MEMEKPDNAPDASWPKEEREAFALIVNDLMFIVCHRVRKPIAAMMGLFFLLESMEVKPEDKARAFDYLRQALGEMDVCTEELVEALERARKALEQRH